MSPSCDQCAGPLHPDPPGPRPYWSLLCSEACLEKWVADYELEGDTVDIFHGGNPGIAQWRYRARVALEEGYLSAILFSYGAIPRG